MVLLQTRCLKCQIINICNHISKFDSFMILGFTIRKPMNTHSFTISFVLGLKIWITLEHGGGDDDDDDEEDPLDDFYDSKEKTVKHPHWMDHYCTVMTCSVEIAEESSETEEQESDAGLEHGDDDDDDDDDNPHKDGRGNIVIKTKVCDGKCERHLGMTQLST